VSSRDSDGDSGRGNREKKYSSLRDVQTANLRRAEESLRVLEEYSRLLSPRAGVEYKKIRFAVYSLEKKLNEDIG
jgi:thiamine-phosphate pyrophosphorylase